MQDDVDILIIGGGPAAFAAAMTLRRAGRSVLVLRRACSRCASWTEMLAPEGAALLKQLGLSDVLAEVARVESPGVISLWGGLQPTEQDFIFNCFGSAWHLDRAGFDESLASNAEKNGVAVQCANKLIGCCQQPDGTWQVSYHDAASARKCEARWIIDATGRCRWFLRQNGVACERPDPVIALIAHFDLAPPDRRLVVEAVPNGWWYFAPVPQGGANVVWITDRDQLPQRTHAIHNLWRQQLQRTRLIHERVGNPSFSDGIRIVDASSSWASHVTGANWLAAGDAAITHEPLSGSGLCRALACGAQAARALLGAEIGNSTSLNQYQRWFEDERSRYVAARAQIYSLVEEQWANQTFWRRRMVSEPSESHAIGAFVIA